MEHPVSSDNAPDDTNLEILIQKAASIKPGSRDALRFCFGRLADSADELKHLEAVVEQADTFFAEEVSPQPVPF